MNETKTMDKPILSPFSDEFAPKPIIEMSEKTMPVFMLGADLIMEIPPLGKAPMNLMITISHIKEGDKLDIRGRMRFEDTGRKTIFGAKKEYKASQLREAKQMVKDIYREMLNGMPLREQSPKWELNFDIGEDMDSILKKMKESDHFNITSIDKN